MAPLLLAAILITGPARPARAADPPSEATPEAMAARLAAEARDVLDRLLGPGRAEVHVWVDGETSEVQTATEVTTPLKPPDGEEPMPGMAKLDKVKDKVPGRDTIQTDTERSSHRGPVLV